MGQAELSEQLRSLFTEEQLRSMDAVRSAMLADPTVLDNHKKKGNKDAEQVKEASTAC